MPVHSHSLNALARAVRQPFNDALEVYLDTMDDDSFGVAAQPPAAPASSSTGP